MAIPRRAAAIAVLIALAGSGCAQPDPNAQPTYTCTPSDGSTPEPCYKAEYDQRVKEDALYAEAEAVYRKYIAEDERIFRLGGVSEATPAMLKTLTGDGLKQASANYQELIANSTTVVGGEFRVGYIRRVARETYGDSIATLESCIDATSATFKQPGMTEPGNVSRERAFFSTTREGLKISHFKTFAGEVAECE